MFEYFNNENFESDDNNKKNGILDRVLATNKVSLQSKNQMEDMEIDLLIEYSENIPNTIYYVAGLSNKVPGNFVLYKYTDGDEEILNTEKEKLPDDFYISSILIEKDGRFILDKEISLQFENEFMEKIAEILENQNSELENYRKENHLYRVEEDVESRIYLWDLTDKPDFSIEEVEFPSELKEVAKEGAVFIYKKGIYEVVNT